VGGRTEVEDGAQASTDKEIRASPAGRCKPATQSVRPGPFASTQRRKMGHGPAHLAGACSGATNPVRAHVLSDLDGL
jgi:hypothetical protein